MPWLCDEEVEKTGWEGFVGVIHGDDGATLMAWIGPGAMSLLPCGLKCLRLLGGSVQHRPRASVSSRLMCGEPRWECGVGIGSRVDRWWWPSSAPRMSAVWKVTAR